MTIRTARHDDTPQEVHGINVTPFIDVILVLLIIFMVAAPIATVTQPLSLPASSATAVPDGRHPVYLSVARDLSLSIGEVPVNRATLAAALGRATAGDAGQRIYVRADRRLSYEDLTAVLDALREAGYLKVALVASGRDGR